MNSRTWSCGLGFILLSIPGVLVAGPTAKVRNEKVLVLEQALAPGETVAFPPDRAGAVVYLDGGPIELTPPEGKPRTETVKRGDAVFLPPRVGGMKNAGVSALRIVRVEFFGKGSSESWGMAGLSPHYRLRFENPYGRVYDIRIPAGTSEPQHSHHDRVVICLSGAELMHEMPDGRKESSTLKTGEIAWRRGGTHVGHNLGKTDLYVIAIEPK
jgi:quercetin dioxygenase-like cupin family protein